MKPQVNPDTFKQKILSKYPDGVTSDGKRYADLDSTELTQRIVDKYPQGTTSDGIKYSDYLKGVPTAPKFDQPVDHKQLLQNAQNDAVKSSALAKSENSFGGRAANFGKDLVSNLASSEVGLGKSIAKIFGNQSDTYLNLINNRSSIQTDLLKTIRAKKAKGEDTSKLEGIYNQGVDDLKKLNEHLAEEHNLPSTAKVAGQLGGTALDLLTAGTYGKATEGMKAFELASKSKAALPTVVEGVKSIARKPVGLFTKAGAIDVAKGAGLGYGFDVTQGLQGDRGEDRTGAKSLIPGLGTAIGASLPLVVGAKQSISNRSLANRANAAKEVDNLVGKIVQGKTEDIARAKKALSNIDTEGIKTYKDLGNILDDKIEGIKGKLDQTLDTNTQTKKLNELNSVTKVGGKEVKHNFVSDALDQLEAHYSKINDPVGEAKIAQLRTKAAKEGLTVKEINNLAREHGGSLNAFNANGEAASGLTKQAAENTRKGLKTKARSIFANPVYNEADSELSNLIRTKKLVDDTAEKVNKLKQKIVKRGPLQKLGRLAGQVVDRLSGGGITSFIQSFMPRGEGLKVMNALDLEKALEKNLSKLDGVLSATSDTDIIQKLEAILEKKSLPNKPSTKALQEYKSVQNAMTARRKAILGPKPTTLKR